MTVTSSSGFASNRAMYSASKLAACLVLALGAALTLFAQEDSAKFSGTVRDQSGAAVAGANVRIVGNGFVWQTHTFATGQFSFPNRPASNANLEVQATGF